MKRLAAGHRSRGLRARPRSTVTTGADWDAQRRDAGGDVGRPVTSTNPSNRGDGSPVSGDVHGRTERTAGSMIQPALPGLDAISTQVTSGVGGCTVQVLLGGSLQGYVVVMVIVVPGGVGE
jgi:hypothetical protein